MRTLVKMVSAAIFGISSIVCTSGVQARQGSIADTADHYPGPHHNAAPMQMAHNAVHTYGPRYNEGYRHHAKDARLQDKKRDTPVRTRSGFRDAFRRSPSTYSDKYGRFGHRDQRSRAKSEHYDYRDRHQHASRRFQNSGEQRSQADRGDIDVRHQERSFDSEGRGSWRAHADRDIGQKDRRRPQTNSDRGQTDSQHQRSGEGGGKANNIQQHKGDGLDTSRTGRDSDQRTRI